MAKKSIKKTDKSRKTRLISSRDPKPRAPRTKNFDYKNYQELARYLNDRAKISGRKRSGLTAKQQRKLTIAVKRARFLGLLPYKAKI